MGQRENTELSEDELGDCMCVTWHQGTFQSLYSIDSNLEDNE